MRYIVFEEILSEHLMYIVGFLQGDGTHSVNTRNRGSVVLELSRKHTDVIFKIKKILDPYVHVSIFNRKRNTNFKKDNYFIGLKIFDLNFRKEILQYVPVGRKSLIVKPPKNIQSFDIRHYLRGLTDADGSLGVTSDNSAFWSICTTSENMKNFILDHIQQTLGFEKKLNRNKRDGVYNIVLFNEDAVFYSKLLYDNSKISAVRKYNRYREILSWVRSRPKCKTRKKSWSQYEDKIALLDSLTVEEKIALLNRTVSSIKNRLWRLKHDKIMKAKN